MVEYVSTSLFESPAQTLVNTVNTVGVMGKGIAKDFRVLYPEMFERYRDFCAGGQFSIGQLYLYRTSHKWVLNFPTKLHWRQPSRIEWIEAGLAKFVETYSQYGITSVSFPQLGTGNGGLSWPVVRPLMEQYLKRVKIPVYIHVRSSDPNFVPEHLSASQLATRSSDLSAARRDIGYEEFLGDIARALKASLKEDEDGSELASLELHEPSGGVALLSGESLLDLWQMLRVRGAVELSEMPGALRQHATRLIESLKALAYIKPMAFGADGRPGVRYAPPASSLPPRIDVQPE